MSFQRVVRGGQGEGGGRELPPDRDHGDVGTPNLSKAVEEDRETRSRYCIPHLRSPYLFIIDLPYSVAPGDHAAARAIFSRVQRALDIRDRWTRYERGSLRRMAELWEKRAGGGDTLFNVRGWYGEKARQDRARRRGEWEEHQGDLKFSRAMDTIKGELERHG